MQIKKKKKSFAFIKRYIYSPLNLLYKKKLVYNIPHHISFPLGFQKSELSHSARSRPSGHSRNRPKRPKFPGIDRYLNRYTEHRVPLYR